MEIRTLPDIVPPDEPQPDEGHVACGWSANDEIVAPDDDDWWLPDHADMNAPGVPWQHRSGSWCPPRA